MVANRPLVTRGMGDFFQWVIETVDGLELPFPNAFFIHEKPFPKNANAFFTANGIGFSQRIKALWDDSTASGASRSVLFSKCFLGNPETRAEICKGCFWLNNMRKNRSWI